MTAYDTAVLADSPIAYWKLDETVGTNATDSSGNGHTATYTNTPTLNQTGPTTVITKAITLNGTNQYVDVGNNAAFNIAAGGPWTVEGWVNFGVLGSAEQDLISEGYEGGASSVSYALGLNVAGVGTTSHIAGGFFDGSVQVAHHSTTTGWQYVAATFDGVTITLYVNGSSIASIGATQSTVAPFSDVRIGSRSDNTGWLTGSVSAVAIYGTALSSTRILAHYTASGGFPVSKSDSDSFTVTDVSSRVIIPDNTHPSGTETAAVTEAAVVHKSGSSPPSTDLRVDVGSQGYKVQITGSASDPDDIISFASGGTYPCSVIFANPNRTFQNLSSFNSITFDAAGYSFAVTVTGVGAGTFTWDDTLPLNPGFYLGRFTCTVNGSPNVLLSTPTRPVVIEVF